MESGLISALSHPDLTRRSRVGSEWLRADSRPDSTFQQGVTKLSPALSCYKGTNEPGVESQYGLNQRASADSLPLIWQWSMGKIKKKKSISVLTSLILKFHAFYRYSYSVQSTTTENYVEATNKHVLWPFFTQMPMRTAGGQNEAGDL